MVSETGSESLTNNSPEVFTQFHEYAVVMPYSQNIRASGERIGENRLSFYSAFNLNAAYELYKDGKVGKLILCGETTFGEKHSTTSTLMKIALLTLEVPEDDIIVLDQLNLDNTAVQIKAVTKYQKDNGLCGNRFLVIDWGFHDVRVKNHSNGFGLNAETAQAEEIHKHYDPKFILEKLMAILPKEFEDRERTARIISFVDRTGLIPRLLLLMGRGASVTDIKKEIDEHGKLQRLNLEDTTGKKKLRET
jgi:hypothetical protein